MILETLDGAATGAMSQEVEPPSGATPHQLTCCHAYCSACVIAGLQVRWGGYSPCQHNLSYKLILLQLVSQLILQLKVQLSGPCFLLFYWCVVQGKTYRPNVVRIGSEEAPVSQRAKDVWVDVLIARYMDMDSATWEHRQVLKP